jgi:hypothetical protein
MIIDMGDGFFVYSEPVDAPKGVKAAANIYAYAQFHSLERVSYGLMLTTDGPKAKEIDNAKVGAYGMEPLALYMDFRDALEDIESEREFRSFEEVPYVEVTKQKDYEVVLDLLDRTPPDGDWQGKGLYDFRDDPPSFQGSVEDYELEEMKRAAEEAFDFMFQGDEWEDAYRELAAEGE